MGRYAVIDLETTGFSPAHHHRVVEIAVVLVDDVGSQVYEWETLVNPQREVSASEVHGLSGRELSRAPTFDEIAGELASLLRGRVPVAHNLAFDGPFLASEFQRLGVSVPLDANCGLCTMQLAGRYLPGSARALESCCDCIGCHIESAHAALCDARAAARLLAYYMEHDRDFLASWTTAIRTAQRSPWPVLPVTCAARMSRGQLARASRQHFLARLASRAPREALPGEAEGYLALLDRVLLDRHVSCHEEDELVAAAEMMGLSREEAVGLHRRYLAVLGRLALEDGIVTDDERADLDLVAHALGLADHDVEEALGCGEEAGPDCVAAFCLAVGDRVVFTGEAPSCEREELEREAEALGLKVTSSVSGRTRLVVAGDPDSLSGKARKARELGIPIVDYGTYLRLLGPLR